MSLLIPKLTIIRDEKYRIAIRSFPSIITGLRGDTVEGAHIGTLGKGMKRSDDEILPIEHCYHANGHNAGEISMFRRELPDYVLRDALRAYAREMYREYKSRIDHTP